MSPLNRRHLALTLAASLTLVAPGLAAPQPSPPGQPATGPGGAEASHHAVSARLYGEGARAYWLFEPADPKPEHAPVIVFNHGWGAMQPRFYRAWIDHLVKRGNIVIYPEYQDSLRTPVADFTPNMLAAVSAALHRLQAEAGHVRPDREKLAVAGHSMGGALAANFAASWEQAGLPRPRAVLCVEPGKTWMRSPRAAVELADLSRIRSDTLLLAVAGDRDMLAQDVDAKRIFNEATQVPLDNKDFVTMVSDEHGSPSLIASHSAPVAPEPAEAGAGSSASERQERPGRERLRARLRQRIEERQSAGAEPAAFEAREARVVDALDFYGTWKLLDALTDAAFYGTNRRYALGNTPEQRFMGVWSDGVPVHELRVTDHP
jgi:acetyl esterase/lipase